MLEPPGSNGKASTMPENPSSLRNEMHAEPTYDERAGKDSRVEVPNSDTVVPETQSENLQAADSSDADHTQLHDGETDYSLSPRVSRLRHTGKSKRFDPLPEIRFLSKPDNPESITSNFTFLKSGAVAQSQTPQKGAVLLGKKPIPVGMLTSSAPVMLTNVGECCR